MTIASDLSRFSDKQFNVNYSLTAQKQLSVAAGLSNAMYSCVSSVYCVWFTLNEAMTEAIGATYNVKQWTKHRPLRHTKLTSDTRRLAITDPHELCTTNDVRADPSNRRPCGRPKESSNAEVELSGQWCRMLQRYSNSSILQHTPV
jgi:hypothetical protein